MELSCGFVIIDETTDKILACHPTGKKFFKGFWDIPKGHIEQGETPIDCAKRELFEETGYKITDEKIYTIGKCKYTSYKDLFIFAFRAPIDTKGMKCTTYFDINGRQVPEVNGYELVDKPDYFFPKLRPIVQKALQTIKDGELIESIEGGK